MPSRLHRFATCERGSVAIVFTFAIFAMMLAVGSAIDYGRAFSSRVQMQTAIDAAVLAAARKHILNDGDVNASIQDYFEVNKPQQHDVRITSVVGRRSGQGVFEGIVTAELPTTFMALAGFERLKIEVGAEVAQANTNVELALVLDTTGSMAGAKLAGLKDSARNLVETLYSLASSPDQVKVGLVPFAQYVNVGQGNRNAPWMSVPADYTTTSYNCWMEKPVIGKSNCRMVTYNYTNDGTPMSWQGEVCDYQYGAEVQRCENQTNSYTWNGCAGSRTYPLNTRDSGYGTRIPGILNAWCPAPIKPLARDQDGIKSAIDAMSADGETYIPAGLVWGWRVLSNREPFTESADDPATASGQVRKFLVLMTDGQNTKSPVYADGSHDDTNEAAANALTEELCNNIKADNIDIFTITFDVSNQQTKNMMQACASSGGGYYDAINVNSLAEAFADIGAGMVMVHLRK